MPVHTRKRDKPALHKAGVDLRAEVPVQTNTNEREENQAIKQSLLQRHCVDGRMYRPGRQGSLGSRKCCCLAGVLSMLALFPAQGSSSPDAFV